MKIPAFLVMTPCGLVCSYNRICEAYHFRLYGRIHGIRHMFNVRYQYHKPNTLCQRTRRRRRAVCKSDFLGSLWTLAPSVSLAKDSSNRRCCSLKCLCVCVCARVYACVCWLSYFFKELISSLPESGLSLSPYTVSTVTKRIVSSSIQRSFSQVWHVE
jgi:hypothetical protein